MSDNHLFLILLACGGLALAVILELLRARRERKNLPPNLV